MGRGSPSNCGLAFRPPSQGQKSRATDRIRALLEWSPRLVSDGRVSVGARHQNRDETAVKTALTTNQHPPGVIAPKTPNDVEPALVETIGMHSGGDAVLGAAAAPVAPVAVFAAPVVVVLGAPPPENCAAVTKLVAHPVDGNSKAPEGVAIVKVGTLSASQPLEIENNAEKPVTPPFASVDRAELAIGEEGRIGETKGFAPAFGLMV